MVIKLYHELYKDLPQNTIDQKVVKYRLLNNLSQVEFAKLCKVSRSIVQDLEYKKVKTSISNLNKILKVIEEP